MAFFRKDIQFIVKNFWPHRSNVKGFSIEKLARKYREEILNGSSNKISNKLFDKSNLKSTREDDNHLPISYESAKREKHWANRDFSEYKQAA